MTRARPAARGADLGLYRTFFEADARRGCPARSTAWSWRRCRGRGTTPGTPRCPRTPWRGWLPGLEVDVGATAADRLADRPSDRRAGRRGRPAIRGALTGLRRIGIDEISDKKGHRYIMILVDHATGRPVWAAPGRDRKTLAAFFTALGETRCAAAWYGLSPAGHILLRAAERTRPERNRSLRQCGGLV